MYWKASLRPADEHHEADKFVCEKCGAVMISKTYHDYDSHHVHRPVELVVVGYTGDAPVSRAEQGEVTLSRSDAEEKWRRDHPEDYPTNASCPHCQATIMSANATYCWKCGSTLIPQKASATAPPSETKPKAATKVIQHVIDTAKCDICDLELAEGDDVVWCPHCGNPAHRDHLISWIKEKGTCPICGKRLILEDYQ